ncbi:hypothetical protein MKX03_004456 [Papaver bracteatum]|nr:hypothetical protein MKX03_004456 [Papaver bracteatum]
MVEDYESASKKSVEEVTESPKGVDGPPLASKDTNAARKPKDYVEIIEANTDRLTAVYKEMDYTYLADLLAEWEQQRTANDGATIRRKIQGMMTGLSRFDCYGRTGYELVVLFSDGSCTSKILIHSDEVQRQIGLTPEETTKFLSSVSKDDMWEAVTVLEGKLSTLQCTLDIEVNNNTRYPVAVEVDSAFDMSWLQRNNIK